MQPIRVFFSLLTTLTSQRREREKMERSLLQWRLLPLLALIASLLSVFFASRSYEVCFVLCFCHVIAVQNGGFVSFSCFLLIPMFVCLFVCFYRRRRSAVFFLMITIGSRANASSHQMVSSPALVRVDQSSHMIMIRIRSLV